MRSGDFIFVKNLLVKSFAGNDAWKRPLIQPLKIDVSIRLGQRLRRLGLTDDIRRTLNYDSLSTQIIDQVENQHFKSVENLARSVLNTVSTQLSTGETGVVEVCRPKAKLLASSHNIKVNSDNNSVTESFLGLKLPTIIGINDLERLKQQIVHVDIEVDHEHDIEVFSDEFTEKIATYVQNSNFLTLESFANSIAELICTRHVDRVRVKLGKPSALNTADVAQVQVERQPSDFLKSHNPKSAVTNSAENIVYIAFGSNIGDTVNNIRSCVQELNHRGITVMKSSAIYKSKPMYYSDQPEFLNGVFKCKTSYAPVELLEVLKDIEKGTYGRVKHFDNGPRPMDLDILLYNDEIINSDHLKVPHIDMLNRSFVLRPLNDIFSDSTASKPAFPEVRCLPEIEGQIVPLFLNSQQIESDKCELRHSVLEFGSSEPTKVMAIVNYTPDSFSDGGQLAQHDLNKVVADHVKNGAQIIDVGGQSTRPGASIVSADVEINRVCPAISAIRAAHPDVIISIDTFRGSVAEAALNSGANMINDVFSGTLDPKILEVAAKSGAPIILSHSRGNPNNMKSLTEYPKGLIQEVAIELRQRIDAALNAGCQTWQIILDPGLGFAKTAEQDLMIVRQFRELRYSQILTSELPLLPWLVGPSRKSFIGHFTGEEQPQNRGPGTIAILTALRQQGVDIVRVHDTGSAQQALRIADKIYS